MLIRNKSQWGGSIIELMISITIGLFIIAGLVQLYASVSKASAENILHTHLNEELRAATTIMSRDIRRTGSWGGIPGIDDMSSNPFNGASNAISVSAYGGEAANSCVLFAYDADNDKAVDDGTVTADDMEQFGYRLNDSAIEMRTGGNTFNCTANTGWEEITTPLIEVTALNYTLNESCLNISTEAAGCPCTSGDPCQYIRSVDLSVTARLAGDNATTTTFTETIRVRNDRYEASAP